MKSLALLGLFVTLSFGQTYQIDTAHSGAAFSVRHMMVTNVSGRFSNLKGSVVIDDKTPANSKVEAVIDVSTVNTNEPKRDGHLKSPDFFDVAKFPTMTFTSTKVYKSGDVTKVEGNLTLHGVTKPVTLNLSEVSAEVKHPMGGLVRGATATTKIKRSDFGLTWNRALEAGGVTVGDEVSITLEIELSRKPA
jgi:polyisoprenoid-binding protein YceI